jgi:hypothetical protein
MIKVINSHYLFKYCDFFYSLIGNDSVNTFPCKQACVTIGRLSGATAWYINTPCQQYKLFSVGSVRMGYKRTPSEYASGVGSERLSFETPSCRAMSLGAEELNGVESSELAIAE